MRRRRSASANQHVYALAVPATSRVVSVVDRFDAYLKAQQAIQTAPDRPISSRDPFAEFSERLVAAWLGGELTDGGQSTYDVIDGEERPVQVRWLAHPTGEWVNEFPIRFVPGVDRFALVFISASLFAGALCLDRAFVPQVSAELGKLHAQQGTTFSLSQADWQTLVAERVRFEPLGISLLLPADVMA